MNRTKMIKFFRHIRKTLISENKMGKYFKYAIGEIILVVIGILIALSINNWNETNKGRSKERKYLINLSKEIKVDSIRLESGWFSNMPRKIKSLNNTKKFISGKYVPNDTIKFIDDVGFGGVNSRASFSGQFRTYKELLSTGNLSLISNDELRQFIVDYYSGKEFIDQYANNIRTEYATYTNSFKVFNSKFPDSINVDEIPRMLKKIKTDAFYGLINQELTYAHSLTRALERSKKSAYDLHNKIEDFLSHNN